MRFDHRLHALLDPSVSGGYDFAELARWLLEGGATRAAIDAIPLRINDCVDVVLAMRGV